MTAPYNRESPVITLSDLYAPKVCHGCGEEKENVRPYTLRTGATGNQVMCWCGLCAKKVALFLMEATLNDREQG